MTAAPGPGGKGLSAGVSLQSALPVLVFLALNRATSLRWAVVAATAISVVLVVDRRNKGIPLGRFMPIVTGAILIRGAIGAITGSETLYFGLGIATKYAVAAVLVGSIALRKPLAEMAAPYVLEISATVRNHPTFPSTMSMVTAVVALYYCLSATLDVWLFRQNTVEGFVIWRFLANWPLSVAALGSIGAILQSRLAGPAGSSIVELIERRFATSVTQDASGDSANG